ncbi:MAG: DUF1801 domain-containing protein [Spirochaetia bacterium]|nr:DUF1801 domain-containing protein [Spirochaetia bacterium]
MKSPETVDEYIQQFTPEIREILEDIRAVIKEAAPDAKERIAYNIPTYTQRTNLVHFAAFKNHIGLYPTPSGTEAFERELSTYKRGKGSVRFPLDKPMPLDLIRRIVLFKVQEGAPAGTGTEERA